MCVRDTWVYPRKADILDKRGNIIQSMMFSIRECTGGVSHTYFLHIFGTTYTPGGHAHPLPAVNTVKPAVNTHRGVAYTHLLHSLCLIQVELSRFDGLLCFANFVKQISFILRFFSRERMMMACFVFPSLSHVVCDTCQQITHVTCDKRHVTADSDYGMRGGS